MVNADADLTEHALTTAEHEARGESDSAPWRFIAYTRLRQEEAMGVDPVVSMVRARALFEDARVAHDLLSAGLAAVALRAARLRAGDLDWESDRDDHMALARQSGHRELESHLELLDVARVYAVAPIRVAEQSSMRASQAWQDRGITATLAVRMLQHFVGLRELGRLGPIEGLFAAGAVASDRPGMQGLLATFRLEAGDHEGTRALVQSFVDDDLATLGRDWVHETASRWPRKPPSPSIGARARRRWRRASRPQPGSSSSSPRRLPSSAGSIVTSAISRTYRGTWIFAIERLAHAVRSTRRVAVACGRAGPRATRRASALSGPGAAIVRFAATLVRDAAGAARFAGSRRLLTAVRKLRASD